MNLNASSLEWALRSVNQFGDSDLFTRPIEFQVLLDLGHDAIDALSGTDISTFRPGVARRFVVPKDDLSYRTATQLDPLDSIVFTAIVYEFGSQMEAKRRSTTEQTVFSHRFNPSHDGQLFGTTNSWNAFWDRCYRCSKDHSRAVLLDIADFYNQIYHHSLENQLIEACIPNQVIRWILSLCGSLTAMVSRGIPVGPHASHMLAELVLCPVDNSISSRGLTFARYVDDIVMFCDSDTDARACILQLANSLDKQQKLLLQRHKTCILKQDAFRQHCLTMIEDRPIDAFEKALVAIIQKHSSGDPYRTIWISQLSDEEVRQFDPKVLETIIMEYLSREEPDYIRLRWFIRRLAQVGHPAAVDVLLREFPRLLPAMSEICRYFLAASECASLPWDSLGNNLLELLQNDVVAANEYYQLSILSLFSTQKQFDHLPVLLGLYEDSSPILRREIILCAARHKAVDWLRELKERYPAMDCWSQRAFLYAAHMLPVEERKFFYRQVHATGLLEEMLVKWGKSR